MSLRLDTTSQFDAVLGIIESRSIQTMKNSGNHLGSDGCKSILINEADQTSLPQLGNISSNPFHRHKSWGFLLSGVIFFIGCW